jgi:enoyl-[acyl-carrier-protein] reductase (NADH)
MDKVVHSYEFNAQEKVDTMFFGFVASVIGTALKISHFSNRWLTMIINKLMNLKRKNRSA